MNDEFMSDELFEELLESVREGGAILRGEKEASRKFASSNGFCGKKKQRHDRD
jgi:hypothetical protein